MEFGGVEMMSRVSFVFCLCVLALVCGCGSRSGVGAAKKGMAAFKDGRYEKAIALFSKAAERIPNSPELYYHLGLAHLEHGNLDPALEALQAALELRPAEGEANILGAMGQVAYHQKAYTNAVAALERALEVSQDDATTVRVLTTLGAVEVCRKNPDLACLHYLRALKLDRKYAPAYYNLAVLYQDQYNLYEEALDQLEMFVRMVEKKDRKRDMAENRIKRLSQKIGTPANVSRNSTRAASLLQDGVNAYVAKQFPKAIKAYKDALVADPQTFSAALGLGEVYVKQGMRAEALEAFKRAADINPTHQYSYHQAADLALQLKQPADASKILIKAIARSPYNAASMRLMAQACHAQARIPEARAYGEFYLSLVPANEPGRAQYESWVRSLKQK